MHKGENDSGSGRLQAGAELHEEVYRPREFIYLPGDPGDAVYLICRGRVHLSFIGEEGERRTVAILEEGELFGELVFDGSAPQGFSAEALTETVVWVIDKWELLKLIRHEPWLAGRLSELLGYKKDLLSLCRR
ncbi:TPA: cyclic nucleotide-binding domain-containing protein [Candidatus Bipolaricaulota bacterium]|nr:cyclic nucleotide-binding domain-containing protein [Candidatus Bipolaricaulota bacterium]